MFPAAQNHQVQLANPVSPTFETIRILLRLPAFDDVREIIRDIYKRPFITAGTTSWTLMLPLTLTSTAASIRWLGGKRWQALHRLIYASTIAGVVHFWWLVKRDVARPEIMAVILMALLGFRIIDRFIATRAPRAGVAVAQRC